MSSVITSVESSTGFFRARVRNRYCLGIVLSIKRSLLISFSTTKG